MKLTYYIILLLAIGFYVSCNKGSVNPGPVSAFNLVNVAENSSPVIPVFGSGEVQWFITAQTVPYGSSFEYSVSSGAIPVLITQSFDTANTIFSGTLNLKASSIYSMFLCGQVGGGHGIVDTLFTQDSPPYYGSDSLAGVRFVNLLQGNESVSVNLVGNASGSEVGGLSYKGVSGFKAYSAASQVLSYGFEVRDAVSDSLLSSFTYNNIAIFKNVTIVIYGSNVAGSSSPISCLMVNDY